ncbi:NAD(P)/FAD-dependent oxidoreductase [Tepidamorphus sp. 3E244]|uniref:NAD(P)/FAD-dependent oxidoreductase n=1 Tax=Tepidamorphus sp. 3E244 TaxID=3385498 RepID=UPI0038FC1223
MPQPSGYPSGSYYAATANPFEACAPLTGDMRADVCVIGGGYAGLSAALHLAEKGFAVTLLEAERIGWGASGRNGGQLHPGMRRDQATLEASVGKEHARRLWDLGEDARHLVGNLIDRHRIDCAYTPGLIHGIHKPAYVDEYRRDVEHLRETYGYDLISLLKKSELEAKVGAKGYHGGTLDMGGGHLHPLNFALGIAGAAQRAGASLHEQSRVTKIERGRKVRVETEGGSVTADFCVVACNGYLDRLLPEVARRVLPINNFIATTKPLSDEMARSLIRDREAVSDSRFVVYYYRLTPDNRMLFGGGESYSSQFPSDIAGFVHPHMTSVYPQLEGVEIDHAWGGTLAITMKRMPYIDRLDANLYTLGGFSGQGVGIAPLSGQLVAEAIGGQMERFDVFSTLKTPEFPGGTMLRRPIMALALMWFALRDRLPF